LQSHLVYLPAKQLDGKIISETAYNVSSGMLIRDITNMAAGLSRN